MFFDDESAEVVISSLRLGEEQDRYFEHIFTYRCFELTVQDILHSMFFCHIKGQGLSLVHVCSEFNLYDL